MADLREKDLPKDHSQPEDSDQAAADRKQIRFRADAV